MNSILHHYLCLINIIFFINNENEVGEVLKHNEKEKIEIVEEDIQTANDNLEAILDENKETEIENIDLEKKLLEKEAQYDDIFNQFMRLQADFSNFKKRVEKEKADIYIYANEKVAVDLLSIIDNLERAIESGKSMEENSSLLEGIHMVLKQLIDVLGKHGIEEIDVLGKPFDMNLHYAVMQEECEGDPNCVIEVLQKGYKINDRILRPAMVKVSK